MDQISNIAVIGAGLMGHGIALTFARAGYQVAITDPIEEARVSVLDRMSQSMALMGMHPDDIDKALTCINVHEDLRNCVNNAQIIFEAVPEKMALKQKIFAEIEQYVSDACILASNTSVMPITEIMSKLKHPERALGTHWWNPPHMIPLVEVVQTKWTKDELAEATFALLQDVGKTPVMVKKDVPGFIGNRLQHALWREAISLVEKGICDASAVDTVIKSSFGRRLAVLGPLENADLVGTDLTLDIHENVLFDLEHKQGPSDYLLELVKAEKLGMKSGEGFYQWSDEEAQRVRQRVADHLSKLEEILEI